MTPEPRDEWPPSPIVATASIIAVVAIVATVWNVLWHTDAGAQNTLTGVVAAATAWAFSRNSQRPPGNGTTNGANGNGGTQP